MKAYICFPTNNYSIPEPGVLLGLDVEHSDVHSFSSRKVASSAILYHTSLSEASAIQFKRAYFQVLKFKK